MTPIQAFVYLLFAALGFCLGGFYQTMWGRR